MSEFVITCSEINKNSNRLLKVFKFGGASVKDSSAVKSMTEIIKTNNDGPLIVIVSAMGKTTNAIEGLLQKVINEEDFSKDF